LKGQEYLSEKNIQYTWTNFTVYFEDNEWIGQDGKKYDITIDSNTAKRILFIRISNFDETNKLKGDAVFVFYDNRKKDKYNSIHKIRFVHTLRKEINDFFEKKYRNDSFRNWVEEKKISEDILSTEHHYKHHMKNLYDCAIANSDSEKLEFFYHTVYETRAIREFMKSGNISILNDIIDIEVKSKIDGYCNFLLEPQVKGVMDNKIPDEMRICFSEMLFKYIMCEYIENINEAMRLHPADPYPFGVPPYVVINAQTKEDGNTEFILENNFLMKDDHIQKMPSINELGFSNENALGGLSTNKKLLKKIGSSEIDVRMEKTDTDGIGKFVVQVKLKLKT
jgi:hypothetical protein